MILSEIKRDYCLVNVIIESLDSYMVSQNKMDLECFLDKLENHQEEGFKSAIDYVNALLKSATRHETCAYFIYDRIYPWNDEDIRQWQMEQHRVLKLLNRILKSNFF